MLNNPYNIGYHKILPQYSDLDARNAAFQSLPCTAALCATIKGCTEGVAITFTPSADKHGIAHADALHAMLNAKVSVEVDGAAGEVTMLYIGHPHPQTDRYLEVIAAMTPPREVKIFHCMELRDMYRHLLTEGKDTL